MGKTILIVEDEQNIVDILSFNLSREGYDTLEAYDGNTGLQLALEQNPDLILLDLMLPGMNGFDVCRKIREAGSAVPILMLTAREEEADKVLGLELGADDYITKPFAMRELLARVKANIRRVAMAPAQLPQAGSEPGKRLDLGRVVVDLEGATVYKDGRALELTQREYDLIRFLASQPGKVFSREALMEHVWNYEGYVGDVRAVDVAVRRLREKVEDDPGNPVLIRRSGALAYAGINQGDRIIVDPSVRLAIEALPAEGDKDLVLEETPDVTFADIGGLDSEIGRIRDAVQLPFQHRALFERYDLKPPKGVLLYGPPGNGKTMIAKAVANALCEGGYDTNGDGSISPAETRVKGVFLSVKGPELLNKYVGESERLIRLIFQRARERAADGNPVVVFIDEMDSLLRTRGSGVSSDVETTIVPQFLSELDGVESLDNVMVIGASNRVDMIDPAVLRPGRLDVKIRVGRPKANQAIAIVDHYLTDDLPLEDGVDAHALSAVLVHDIYGASERRHLCDVQEENGQWHALFLADVVSGAMLKNIVDRAKTRAVKESIETGSDVALTVPLLAAAVEDEYRETRDSMADVDPEQWSRINGMDPIRRIRTAE